MTQLSHTLPVDFFQMPSLLKLAQRIAAPIKKMSVPRSTGGLSFADIANASLRATAKNGLKVRPNPNRALRAA
jgi:hypothetical protein